MLKLRQVVAVLIHKKLFSLDSQGQCPKYCVNGTMPQKTN